MAKNQKSVGNNGSVDNYAELYTKHLISKHGQTIVPETVGRKLIKMTYISEDGLVYDTKAERNAANKAFAELIKKDKEAQSKNAIELINRKNHSFKNKGWKVSKQRK